MRPVVVTALSTAPVKGLRVVEADELAITAAGPAGDRAFLVVGAKDHRLNGSLRSPELVQVVPRWDPESRVLGLRFPGGETVAEVVEPGEPATTRLHDGRPVSGRLVEGALSEALSGHLGRPVRLLELDEGQAGADDAPVTLMSTGSLGAVADALGGGPLDRRRFRMTIAVEGLDPWEEHGWGGSEVAVGEAVLRVDAPVPRCAVTTGDPDDGRRDVPVLKALARLRGKRDVTFGVWCDVVRPGRVRVGDQVERAA